MRKRTSNSSAKPKKPAEPSERRFKVVGKLSPGGIDAVARLLLHVVRKQKALGKAKR